MLHLNAVCVIEYLHACTRKLLTPSDNMPRGNASARRRQQHQELHRDAQPNDIDMMDVADARQQLRLALEELNQLNDHEAELTAMKITEAKLAAAKRRRTDIKDRMRDFISACLREAGSYEAKGEGSFKKVLMTQALKEMMQCEGYLGFLQQEKTVDDYNNGCDKETDKLADAAEYQQVQKTIFELLTGGSTVWSATTTRVIRDNGITELPAAWNFVHQSVFRTIAVGLVEHLRRTFNDPSSLTVDLDQSAPVSEITTRTTNFLTKYILALAMCNDADEEESDEWRPLTASQKEAFKRKVLAVTLPTDYERVSEPHKKRASTIANEIIRKRMTTSKGTIRRDARGGAPGKKKHAALAHKEVKDDSDDAAGRMWIGQSELQAAIAKEVQRQRHLEKKRRRSESGSESDSGSGSDSGGSDSGEEDKRRERKQRKKRD